MKYRHDQQAGFAYIAAIMIVLVLAMLAAAAVKLNTTQQATSSQDILSAQAWQSAYAGTEWGLYQALNLHSCPAASTTLNLTSATGFSVTVTCTARPFKEGEVRDPGTGVLTAQNKVSYTIDAIACNAATCPDNTRATTVEYTERRRVVTACALQGGGDCY